MNANLNRRNFLFGTAAAMTFAGCNCKRLPLARADYRGWDIVV